MKYFRYIVIYVIMKEGNGANLLPSFIVDNVAMDVRT